MCPMPVYPRGPRRRRLAPDIHLVACPRVCPDWELATVGALVKPQTKATVEHRSALQRWTGADDAAAARVIEAFDDRLGLRPGAVRAAGEYHLLLRIPPDRVDDARAVALALSRAIPGVRFVVDRLFTRGGRLFRRERGYKLAIVPASNVHLPRDLRRGLRGLV